MFIEHVLRTALDSQSALSECWLLPALCDLCMFVCGGVGRWGGEVNAEVFTQLPASTFSLSSCLFPPGRTGKEAGCREA